MLRWNSVSTYGYSERMATLHDYGPLLLASRMRKVSETFYAGVDDVYRSLGIELPARCFPILLLLRDLGRLGISELAVQLGQSHPAVSQMSRKLLSHGLVNEWPDPSDDRRRLLSLSRRGQALMSRLEPVWKAISAAVEELEKSHPLSVPLTAIDRALEGRGFASRIRSQMDQEQPVRIIAFRSRYAQDFKRLNFEWLQKYFRVEPVDEVVLSDPRKIIDAGGSIFLAQRGREIIGTCALIAAADGRYELTKMSVTHGHQGLGIGRRLLNAALEAFKLSAARELFLDTNSILTSAIALYESVGFVHAKRRSVSAYERSNVYMVYRKQH